MPPFRLLQAVFEQLLDSLGPSFGSLWGQPFRMTSERVPKPISVFLQSTFCKNIVFVTTNAFSIHPQIPWDPPNPADQVSSTTAWELPSIRAGSQDDVSSEQTPSNYIFTDADSLDANMFTGSAIEVDSLMKHATRLLTQDIIRKFCKEWKRSSLENP